MSRVIRAWLQLQLLSDVGGVWELSWRMFPQREVERRLLGKIRPHSGEATTLPKALPQNLHRSSSFTVWMYGSRIRFFFFPARCMSSLNLWSYLCRCISVISLRGPHLLLAHLASLGKASFTNRQQAVIKLQALHLPGSLARL